MGVLSALTQLAEKSLKWYRLVELRECFVMKLGEFKLTEWAKYTSRLKSLLLLITPLLVTGLLRVKQLFKRLQLLLELMEFLIPGQVVSLPHTLALVLKELLPLLAVVIIHTAGGKKTLMVTLG